MGDSSFDYIKRAEELFRHQQANRSRKANKPVTLQDLKALQKDAISDSEREVLEEAIKRLQEREARLSAFNASVVMSVMAGGKPVAGMDLEAIKHHALHNIQQTDCVSLREAQLRVDELLSSGSTKDFAELVRWGTCHLNENDARREHGDREHLRPQFHPAPGAKPRRDELDFFDI